MGRERVDAQLQIFFRFFLVARPARLVIHNFFFTWGETIHLVHPPGKDDVVLHRQLERLFLRDHIGRRGQRSGVERAQLREAVLLVFLFLILILEPGRGPLELEFFLDFFKRQRALLRQFPNKIFNRIVHYAAEADGGSGTASQPPRAGKKIFLRTRVERVDSRRTELQGLRDRRPIREGPLADLRTDSRVILRQIKKEGIFSRQSGSVGRSRRDLFDVAAFYMRIHQDVVQKWRGLRALVLDRTERQAV